MKTTKELLRDEAMCYYHLNPEHRPKEAGNCYECQIDDKNQNCRGYRPIAMPHIIKQLLREK